MKKLIDTLLFLCGMIFHFFFAAAQAAVFFASFGLFIGLIYLFTGQEGAWRILITSSTILAFRYLILYLFYYFLTKNDKKE